MEENEMKKLISTILALSMLLTMCIPAFAADDVFGDVNGDGLITAVDARIILQVVAGSKEETEIIKTNGDLNNDGNITAVDARIILQVVAEIISAPERPDNENDEQEVPADESFNSIKEYLLKYGYKTEFNGYINYEYIIKDFGSTNLAVIYRVSTDSILLRYENSNRPGYDILNVCIAIFNNDDTIEISTIVYEEKFVNSYTPSLKCEKSELTKGTSIRYNNNSVPSGKRQFIDEYTSDSIHIILPEANKFFAKAGTNLSELGFVNY
jgi:hypothetical protein